MEEDRELVDLLLDMLLSDEELEGKLLQNLLEEILLLLDEI